MKLNLETNSREQELVKAHLEENASETLAEKINNGTPFEKDEKTLINKKTLDGFMKFASDEARKLASKSANFACVEDKVVYSWAVHYFEEDSIEGTLFNADGTEYKPTPKPAPAQVGKVEPKKPEQRQATLFDFMKQETAEPEKDYDELTEEEMREFDGDIEEPQNLDDEPDDGFDASAFDKTAVVALVEIFGDKLTVR